MTATEPPSHSPDIVGALILITVGILLLLNNLNLVPWSIWQDLWQFWPVLLILWGVQMVFGPSLIGKLITFCITVLVLVYLFTHVINFNQNSFRPGFPNESRYSVPSWRLGDPNSL